MRQQPRCGLTITLLTTFLLAAPALARPAVELSPPQRVDVWLVNTRCAPECGDLEAGLAAIRCWRLSSGCPRQWVPAPWAELASADAATMTTIYAHGNRSKTDDAINHAWLIYQRLQCEAIGRPQRLIIWSWAADRAYWRPRPDARVKLAQTDVDSFYLARLLPGVSKGPVHLIGYSFGARIVCGALELLAGGQVAGHGLPREEMGTGTSRQPISAEARGLGSEPVPISSRLHGIRLTLVAAAMDADSLAPGGRYGRALTMIDRAVVTRNVCDSALRWYARLCGRHGPQALGRFGPASTADGKLQVVDVSREVGRKHVWANYFRALDSR